MKVPRSSKIQKSTLYEMVVSYTALRPRVRESTEYKRQLHPSQHQDICRRHKCRTLFINYGVVLNAHTYTSVVEVCNELLK